MYFFIVPLLPFALKPNGRRDDLVEEAFRCTKVTWGRGITAGICVAFIAITADRLIGAWAQKRKSELGLNAESQL